MKQKHAHIKFSNPTVKTAENYVKMVGIGDWLGTVLVGPPGMGKTHLIRQVLDECGVEYMVYGGHITVAGMYELLWENQDALIFFDDVSSVITNTEIMEMLKQALQIGHERKLHYRSKGVLAPGVPNEFEFRGKIIFAFNKMDSHNLNVKAILDRAPNVELEYSRKEIIEACYKIAAGDTGGLMEYEKLIVVKEIEDYTDSTMDVSLRKLFLAFDLYRNFKKIHGEGNEDWINETRLMFGQKKQPWLVKLVRQLVGDGRIKRTELAREIALQKDMSHRNAQRKISDFLEMELLYQNKMKGGDISVKPFGGGAT